MASLHSLSAATVSTSRIRNEAKSHLGLTAAEFEIEISKFWQPI